jgi:CHAT domain-containing protein
LIRALAIREKFLGSDHPEVAIALGNLAHFYHQSLSKFPEADLLYRRALVITLKIYGPDSRNEMFILANLAQISVKRKEYSQAETLYKRTLNFFEKIYGDNHPVVANNLSDLASLYQAQKNYADAEPLYMRAISITEKTLGQGHPDLANAILRLAQNYQLQGNYLQAFPFSKRAAEIFKGRILGTGLEDSESREAFMGRAALGNQLYLLALNPTNEINEKVTNEALEIIQLIQFSSTASAITKMTARLSSANPELVALARKKQDAVKNLSESDARLISASSQPSEVRDLANEERLRKNIALTTNQINFLSNILDARFPAYQELTHLRPLSVKDIQRLLAPNEGLIVFAGKNNSYVLTITPKTSNFKKLPVKIKELESQISKIRGQMEFDSNGKAPLVSLNELHELYNNIIGPILPELTGLTHLMIVPEGSLQSFPFGMLVSAPPPEINFDIDYRKVEWFTKRYAISVLPSVSSIQGLRLFPKIKTQQMPFVGFGDPLIGKDSSLKIDTRKIFNNFRSVTNKDGKFNIADVDLIRTAPRLPETAVELRAISKALNADSQSVWLQDRATESQVKAMDLSKYRILAFATHGVMAGELKGINEPGLILTPPKVGSLEDDGYLSAGEIANLNLNAEWVILSACNTAASDGTLGAEGLSGMAKAFFYAGARSLLVSHWPVESEATARLTTVMLKEYDSNLKQGKAQSHRKAILNLMNTPNHPEYAHPLFWAPFVVVGEGGTGEVKRGVKVN